MRQIQKHLIKPNNSYFKEIDEVCFKSKNLYNTGVYLCRQALFSKQKRPNYYDLNNQLKTSEAYRALPSKVAQQTLMLVDKAFKGYEIAHADWEKNPDRYLGEPRYPKYKDKLKGRYAVVYTEQAISKPKLKEGIIKPSQTNIEIPTKLTEIKQVRFIPFGNNYKVEIIYESNPEFCNLPNNRFAAIDIGINNLATVVSNVFKPFLVCGKALKAANRHWNKRKAKLQSFLPEKTHTSKKINAVTSKRNNKIDYYLHTASRYIINYLSKNDITHLVIGKNANWKQNINIGKRNNQNFTNIPHARFIEQLKYKAALAGIRVTITEESYTSKCSFVDLEPIKKHHKYLGKRTKRGLFTSSTGSNYNADCNGAGNILRKVVGNSLFSQQDSILRCVVHPVRIKSYKTN
jgi:putative transposase